MQRFMLTTVGLAISLSFAPACGAVSPEESSASADELRAHVPIPFGLQFVGTYEDVEAPPGAPRTLELRRDGRYVATFAGQAKVERGVFRVPAEPRLPYPFLLIAHGHTWTATVTAYDEALHAQRKGKSSDLHAHGHVGPNESICDASHGSWTDDDADVATGLYCVCAPPDVYIPSAGGCVP